MVQHYPISTTRYSLADPNRGLIGLIAISLLMVTMDVARPADRLDIVLIGGRVVDGTGAPYYPADVGIVRKPATLQYPLPI